MWEEIKDAIHSQDFDTALQLISDVSDLNQTELYILKGEIYYSKKEFENMFEMLRLGLSLSPCNYELYYMLGLYYLEKNPDQAFLCMQNALFYCHNKQDREEIQNLIENIRQANEIHVKKTAIVIVSFNSCYLLKQTIDSIRNTLPQDSYQIVVVDNASSMDVREYLNNQSDIHCILNDTNTGFAHACNQGCLDYTKEDIFLLNNDTRLASNSLFWLKMGLYENDYVGACGSLSNYAGNRQQIEKDFHTPSDYLRFAESISLPMVSPYEERTRLSGFAMLIRQGLWQEVHGMDEIFSPGYFEDDDLSMKIRMAGYHLNVCLNSYIYHAGSQSFSLRSDLNELLANNHCKFIRKYGFDILQYAYENPSLLNLIPFSSSDSFNMLYLGAALGADSMMLRKKYPNINLISIEGDTSLYQIVEKDPTTFLSLDRLNKLISTPIFQIVVINHKSLSGLSANSLTQLKKLCTSDCKILHLNQDISNQNDSFSKESTFELSSIDFSKIKLIVWDMDETFWKGTLSEGDITPLSENVQLIKDLTDCGLVNSISSKNENKEVLTKLSDLGVQSLFVFNNINWESKGPQLQEKIQNMFLRPENVLFIDDNPHNLKEAAYLLPDIMTATPDVIPHLTDYVHSLPKKDLSHSRLAHYQLLEKKSNELAQISNKSDFLAQCDIRITIKRNCLDEINRIADLVQRTNQLNYTKIRDSAEILTQRCQNPFYECGYISAADRYGDYGIVGFFCMDSRTDSLEHFLFSCRVIGMGIEQYVYVKLGCPSLTVVPPVAVDLTDNNTVSWITEVETLLEASDNSASHDSSLHSVSIIKHAKPKILLKGPCDMSAISSYLIGGDVTCEFNYVNQQGYITAGQNHSLHLKMSLSMPPEQLRKQIKEVPFLDSGDFYSNLFKESYDIICYSLLPDCHTGIYEKRDSSFSLSFGSKNFDLTDSKNWKGYIDGSLPNHGFPFSEKILSDFQRNWWYKGCLSVDNIIDNLHMIKNNLLGNPLLILLLGSEIEYKEEGEEFKDHAAFHKQVNDAIKKAFSNHRQIKIVDTTSYIHSQNDYMDCINHYSRNVYYNMATQIVSYINDGKN